MRELNKKKDMGLLKDFFKCGIAGWCIEIIWTGLGSLMERNWKMEGSTSILMFPIYGLAAFIKPLYKFTKRFNLLVRGIIYTTCIFITEYVCGYLLRLIKCCPWNYSSAKSNIHGLIRLDYIPAWFLVGILFEKLLSCKKCLKESETKKEII